MMQRIGLTQRVDAYPDRNEYRDALDQAWVAMLVRLGYMPIVLPNLIEDIREYLDALEIDGVIFTGGNDLDQAPQRDRFEHALLDVCAATFRPMLGVCRGVQIAVQHHGGALVEIAGHVGTRHPIKACGANAVPIRDRAVVNSYHRFGPCSERLADCWRIAALAEDGTVEAIQHNTHTLVGIMWHPEREPYDAQDVELIHHLFGRHR